MAKLTREKYNEINAKCGNGFELDVQAFMYHGDKQVCKYIDLGNGKKLKASIYFGDVRVGYEFKSAIKLHLSIWEPCDYNSDMMLSRGLGYTVQISDIYERKKFADIIAKTREYKDYNLLDIAKNHMVELQNECIVG